ncbi:FAD-dependent monooxygenase [Spirosoma utsteinense]|uniref:2-polyprenyl-6-methoxyphenol hydroxylase-like FAD-dependent oxidoreductase n=1 Tax=Spirosoma utsteinense TaxID=2585773 RepID=A0ABR6WEN3_9BACT|nr:FAD-dependent monooxygenase [Spirosoma utsteinense]MBC3788293.1 2-polyprenyl-6-methoxyphenol hydroxylase-like FAD-dependent oxidoreductase [Spirosoma utsteinense]MBC3794992.1 2-polyprenyl-6-methoxyphenol hydroxylase-like FAD-dependent oxidoreductase [Spirosoma utsteinense]
MNKQLIESETSVVVVGASLAGLMTGIALANAGLNVTIVERAGAERRSGAGLQVNNGERDISTTAKYLRKITSGGSSSVEAWSSIEARLRREAQTNPQIDLRFNTRIQAVHQNDEAAWVITDKGEKFSGDMLIGADGYRSTVRRHVAPDHPDATFAGYLIWVAMVDEQNIPKQYRPGPNPGLAMPNGNGDFLLGFVVAGADGSCTVGQRRLGWAWYDNTQNDLLRQLGCVKGNVVQHSLTGADIPTETLANLSKKAKQRWSQPWLAAIEHSIQTRNLVATPIVEYVPEVLVQGRIALVGDAAHVPNPLTASGFNASLEDAATLTDCFIKENDVTEALLQYQSRRLKQVRQIVQSGQSFSRSFGR